MNDLVARDGDAWSALVVDLRRYVSRRAPAADVDDLVQDVLARAFTARETLRPGARIEPWLFTIARNALIDRHRRRPPPSLDPEDEPDRDPDLEHQAIDLEFTELREAVGAWLTATVQRLPDPYRDAVHRVDVLGQSQAEVAQALGLSYSGLKSRVQRGRAKVRDQFLACCDVQLDARGALTAIEPRANACVPACCDDDSS